ncbi:MAG: hypothetical protein JKY95_14670 [Planctomycetaceae bacterium]|nr:hypothetical protein [Planctomycetaceae bacterium]
MEIRKLSFEMGLNIIQGKVNESADVFETGHGNGKTTLCRLIRYCLGEKTFGQKHIVEEVRHCFPGAYVGAIIEVDGVQWSVLRGLAQRARHYAKQETSLADLVSAEGPKGYSDFIDTLKQVSFEGFAQRDVLSNSQPIQWLHLLAMCSRDQESRYDRFWNWRHSRSESLSPKFAKPKIDAGLCVRAILGLLDPAESALRTELEQFEESLTRIQEKIKKKEAEPSFHITQLRNTLASEFGIEDATTALIEKEQLFGISQVVEKKLEALRTELDEIDEKIAPLDRQINLASASMLEPTEMSDQRNAASKATNEGTDTLLNDLEEMQSQRQLLIDLEVALCIPGGIAFGDCEMVQAHVLELDQNLEKLRTEVLPQTSEREQVAAELSEQSKRLQRPIDKLRQRLDDLNQQKDEFLERRIVLKRWINRIPKVTAELLNWNDILNGTTPNTELTTLKADEATAESDIIKTKTNLGKVIAEQSKRAKQFGGRFNKVVQQTINNEFKGIIGVDEDGINFRISQKNSLSGEAYETLAVLLADIALLLESSLKKVHHPGFLIHDSPREADLNLRIYERLLEEAASLMQDSRDGEDIPFQYIVTTTTPPSEQLQNESITMHTLSSGSGSLFGMQLEVANPDDKQKKLFDVEGEKIDEGN